MKVLPISNCRLPIENGNPEESNWQLAIGNWK